MGAPSLSCSTPEGLHPDASLWHTQGSNCVSGAMHIQIIFHVPGTPKYGCYKPGGAYLAATALDADLLKASKASPEVIVRWPATWGSHLTKLMEHCASWRLAWLMSHCICSVEGNLPYHPYLCGWQLRQRQGAAMLPPSALTLSAAAAPQRS